MNKRSMMSVAAILALTGCAALSMAQAGTQDVAAPGATEERTAETTAATDGFALLEKQVEAVGGREAGVALKGLRMEGSFSMPAMNLTGPLTIEIAAPNKMRVMIDFPQFGSVEQGTNGTVAWRSPFPGAEPVIEEGPMAEQITKQANLHKPFKPREMYKSAEHKGTETYRGMQVHRIEVVDQNDTPMAIMLDVEKHWRVAELTKSTPAATGYDIHKVMTDYRLVGEKLWFPFKTVNYTPQGENTITLTEIVIDPEFDEAAFTAPGEL
jgi:hypothetical protein